MIRALGANLTCRRAQQALREAMSARQRGVADKLRATDEAMKCIHPTADIEVVMSEIENGYRPVC